MERPKIHRNAYARINMTCRVCVEMLECYVLERNANPKEATIYDAAQQCAGTMAKHMQEEHGYPKSIFNG